MEDRISFKRISNIKQGESSRTVKIDSCLYDKLQKISSETGISIKVIASKMLEFAIDKTDII